MVLHRPPEPAGLIGRWQSSLAESRLCLIFRAMSRRFCLRLGILALLAAVRMPQFSYAQSLSCRDRQSQISTTFQTIKITIADVEFSGENPLSNDARAQLVERIKQLDLSVTRQGDDSEWLGQVEVPIRETLQKQGYFRVLPTIAPYLVRAETHALHYVVTVEIDSGPQYRLDEIHFSGATVFTATELRASFSLHHGDLFDPSELRKGMESMARVYGQKGFIDMVPQPETNLDDKNLLIDVLFRVDEGKQYHVRRVEVHGLDLQAEQALKSRFEPGGVFDTSVLWNLFNEHNAGLPTDLSLNDVIQVRYGVNASVDLLIDFRPCPKSLAGPRVAQLLVERGNRRSSY
jgi:Surface antigen variable number repeat